jgi:hypothetical protein
VKPKFIALLVIILLGYLILASCSGQTDKSPEDTDSSSDGTAIIDNVVTPKSDLPDMTSGEFLLDRETIIAKLQEIKDPNSSVVQNETIHVLLDDSSSVACYASENTLFAAGMEVCGKLFESSDSRFFKGYRISELSSVSLDDTQLNKLEFNPDPSVFFTKIVCTKSYNQSDESPLVGAMAKFLRFKEPNTKNLYVIVTDLFVTDENGQHPKLMDLPKVMESVVSSKLNNVALIALQSMCYSGIPAHIDSDFSHYDAVKSISLGKDGGDKVLKNYINGGHGAKRPIYLLLLGDAELVERYKKSITDGLRNYSNTDVQALSLDDFPYSNAVMPKAQPLETSLELTLDDDFQKYAKELPTDVSALNHVFTPSIGTGSPTATNWDQFITDKPFPFFRIWVGDSNSGFDPKTRSKNFSVTYDLGSKVTTKLEKIQVHCFYVDEHNKTIHTPIEVEGNNGNDIRIENIENVGSKLKISMRLQNTHLELNRPLLVLLDLTLEKDIPASKYDPIAYANEHPWIYDWTLAANEYFETAYWWEEPKINNDGSIARRGGWRFWLDGSHPKPQNKTFELYNKTLNFSDFVTKLYEDRAQFIHDNNMPWHSDNVHQYAIFGFVLRQSYALERSGNSGKTEGPTKDDDNGGYAFSINEIREITKQLQANTE